MRKFFFSGEAHVSILVVVAMDLTGYLPLNLKWTRPLSTRLQRRRG